MKKSKGVLATVKRDVAFVLSKPGDLLRLLSSGIHQVIRSQQRRRLIRSAMKAAKASGLDMKAAAKELVHGLALAAHRAGKSKRLWRGTAAAIVQEAGRVGADAGAAAKGALQALLSRAQEAGADLAHTAASAGQTILHGVRDAAPEVRKRVTRAVNEVLKQHSGSVRKVRSTIKSKSRSKRSA